MSEDSTRGRSESDTSRENPFPDGSGFIGETHPVDTEEQLIDPVTLLVAPSRHWTQVQVNVVIDRTLGEVRASAELIRVYSTQAQERLLTDYSRTVNGFGRQSWVWDRADVRVAEEGTNGGAEEPRSEERRIAETETEEDEDDSDKHPEYRPKAAKKPKRKVKNRKRAGKKRKKPRKDPVEVKKAERVAVKRESVKAHLESKVKRKRKKTQNFLLGRAQTEDQKTTQ